MRTFDVAILGAGAAGLMCAAEAGRRGRKVLVLDHADRVGKKILISGGGRCNFTNTGCAPENFISENPHFARSALARYTAGDFIALVERHGIKYHEKTLGQLFCDGSSREIVAMLEKEGAEAHVTVWTSTKIGRVERQEGGGFFLETSQGGVRAEAVVVATGGLSIPQMGATGLGYEIAREFGLRVTACRPGLVPLTLRAEDRTRWCDLSGVSALVAGKGERKKVPSFREKLLVTHKGLSGPAVLQISSYWREGEAVELDLASGDEVFKPLLQRNARRDAGAVLGAVKAVLPGRWAERWVSVYAPALGDGRRDFTNGEIAEMERAMHQWRLTPAGTEGYAKAEVTTGGIDTAELDAKTMEVRKVPGLYFVGEVVDVTGWLGGYNFQWAWASGYCAGQAV